MNRRSFITKALAGIAAVPVLGKVARAVRSQGEPLIFSKHGPTGDLEFVWVDDAKVYDRALSQEEIERLYNVRVVSSASS
jgi:hypothetical protein